MHATVERRMREAYYADSSLAAETQPIALARELERTHPSAAAFQREVLSETPTVARLGMRPTPARTPNPSQPPAMTRP